MVLFNSLLRLIECPKSLLMLSCVRDELWRVVGEAWDLVMAAMQELASTANGQLL